MRTYHALPAALLAALALTACQDGTGTKDEGAAEPQLTATATATASTTPTKAAADKASNTAGTAAAGKATNAKDPSAKPGNPQGTKPGAAAPADRVSCNGTNTTVTAQPVPRPLNHMLITVKNTGSKMCDLTYYPVLRFDEMQWAPQPIEDSKPQAVTTLAPGESGYAGVLLSAADGSGDGGTTGHKLTVGFQGRTPNSSGGPSAIPRLPSGGVYYDSSLTVTYWLRDRDDALSY
ncbi:MULTISPECIES: DUF4232 domain-containing protein [Streptomyces]|uniref:DUF4232 domain-containing protein n=1 Tax=Streptomyces chartreusis NRRL 3882 TaxID=1079985 RepID=A0A2N9B9D8_STRCX|nr:MULTISPECIES: DUF4232 domain-containing protein [Streptomyces]MYS93500.1 DUF4232 domain-containing protein [Streptomyces sp. SID5464]SOR79978.1 hypothetical protein SCNRRL3882_3436 [Streptomyces chartreusis NRRL 3882]